ncbi:hypothetical protein RR46_05050 [Papilio xuthus]|uniref:MANSC domain-containing protein n=1 Tax=Papilio xuthus TaxID=66420 RepID=A0A194Q0I6_PAPXU|nr:hypothetical protein RR46_05050 [Papilio xuthus]
MRACAWWAALVLAVARARELDPVACSARFDVQRDKIIRTEESREMGARYLAELDVGSRAECLRLCCETDACDVFVFEEKSPGSCYLFACGPPEDFRCKFTAHGNFSSGVLALSRRLAERQDRQRHEEQLARLRNPSTTSRPAATAVLSPRPPGTLATPAGLPQQQASPTQSQQPQQPRRCSRYQFECRRGGECIAVYNACDGVPQCADHSDEAPELGCPAPVAPLAPAAPPAPAATPAPAAPSAPRPPHAQVEPAAAGAAGAAATGGAADTMGAGEAGDAGQPEGADAGELWPWRLTQAQRRYPGVTGPGGGGGSTPHIFSHQGGLLQSGAVAPGWPRRAWPLGPPPGPPPDASRSAMDSLDGDGDGEGEETGRGPAVAEGASGGRHRTRPGPWPEERPGAWPEERPRAWPEERRAWPVPARLNPWVGRRGYRDSAGRRAAAGGALRSRQRIWRGNQSYPYASEQLLHSEPEDDQEALTPLSRALTLPLLEPRAQRGGE